MQKKIGIYLVESKKIGGAWQINLMMLNALNKLVRENYEIIIFQEEKIWSKYLSPKIRVINLKRKLIPKIIKTIIVRMIKSKELFLFFLIYWILI